MSLTGSEIRYDGCWIQVCQRHGGEKCICGYHDHKPSRRATKAEYAEVVSLYEARKNGGA